MCLISIIAARSLNNIIGVNNSLPWHLPSDLKHFKHLTTGNIVIMGRKTYESIGKPLPNRVNIVISTNSAFKPTEGVIVATDPKHAIKEARMQSLKHNINDAYIIGGTTIYQAFIKRADKMILTTIQAHAIGDTQFPEWRATAWKPLSLTEHFDDKAYMLDKPDTKGLKYVIEEYERLM